MDDEPLLGPEAAFVYDALVALLGDRQSGLALGAIPIVAIDTFARRAGMTDDEFWRFCYIIQRVDRFQRAALGKKPNRTEGGSQ